MAAQSNAPSLSYPQVLVHGNPSSKINEIKALRDLYGLGLRDSKELVDRICELQKANSAQKALADVLKQAVEAALNDGVSVERVNAELSNVRAPTLTGSASETAW